MHRIPIIKKFIHSYHHTTEVMPSDWISVHPLELLVQSFGIIIPLYIIDVDEKAYIISCLFKQLNEVYIHSDIKFNTNNFILIDKSHHKIHHLKSGGNYGQLFYFWDHLMNTKIN